MEVKRILRVVLYLIGIALLALIALFAFGLWHAQKTVDAYGIGGGASTKTTPVEVVIGERGYLIPRNYIGGYGKDGIDKGFAFDALLPDFLPRTAENKPEFDKGGHGNKYFLTIKPAANKNLRSGFEGQKRFSADVVESGTRYGLKVYLPKNPPQKNEPIGKRSYEYYLNADSSGNVLSWLECLPPESLDVGSARSLGCTEYFYFSGLRAQALFSRDYLPKWQENQKKLFALFDKFHEDYVKSKQPLQ